MKAPVLLVVDDDELVLELLNDILQDEFTVVTATDGPSALEKLRLLSELDGVITDFDMPRMSGLELMWRIRQRYPTLPMVGLSGTLRSHHQIAGRCPEGAVFLQKPFEVSELLTLARRLFQPPGNQDYAGRTQL
ncbi:response regulator [Chloracidobacterium thermophilum]|uniref:Response regulator containing CheY-like receiver, AAA-type ATPase, and DNA-binding domains n=1 Tax=Chloracidobacterium thermophilum (strain B) TaxID=981222 RepID=G2LH14_CHLTF|nr:response regulator [Chloracidobacterium thermophilum]AEP11514.1 Response regulator containing CheY-like receiver, AAA-type ATPase, and DNA-binding domains [Chloracidobacterium thermophilum B]QUV79409.1 response regulator [Chloracidobacterium thermophilum]